MYINLLIGVVVLLRVRLERGGELGGELGGRDRSARALETCHLSDLASDVGNERVVFCLVGLCSFIVITSVQPKRDNVPDDFGRETASKFRRECLGQFSEVKACEVREAALVSYPLYVRETMRCGIITFDLRVIRTEQRSGW